MQSDYAEASTSQLYARSNSDMSREDIFPSPRADEHTFDSAQFAAYLKDISRALFESQFNGLSPVERCYTSSSVSSGSTYDTELPATPGTIPFSGSYPDPVPYDASYDSSSFTSIAKSCHDLHTDTAADGAIIRHPGCSYLSSPGGLSDIDVAGPWPAWASGEETWETLCEPLPASKMRFAYPSRFPEESFADVTDHHAARHLTTSDLTSAVELSLDPVLPFATGPETSTTSSLTEDSTPSTQAEPLLTLHHPRPVRPIPLIRRNHCINLQEMHHCDEESPSPPVIRALSDSLMHADAVATKAYLRQGQPLDPSFEAEISWDVCMNLDSEYGIGPTLPWHPHAPLGGQFGWTGHSHPATRSFDNQFAQVSPQSSRFLLADGPYAFLTAAYTSQSEFA